MKGSGGSLLSWKTIARAQSSTNGSASQQSTSKTGRQTVVNFIEEYDDLFHGVRELKNYQIKLHVDEDIPPVAQPHRRVPFHVRKQLEEQLRRDEELGVLERIKGPTPWVTLIGVAPKPKSPG